MTLTRLADRLEAADLLMSLRPNSLETRCQIRSISTYVDSPLLFEVRKRQNATYNSDVHAEECSTKACCTCKCKHPPVIHLRRVELDGIIMNNSPDETHSGRCGEKRPKEKSKLPQAKIPNKGSTELDIYLEHLQALSW